MIDLCHHRTLNNGMLFLKGDEFEGFLEQTVTPIGT